MQNKDLENLEIEEIEELIHQIEEENQNLKVQILEKKEILEELISIME